MSGCCLKKGQTILFIGDSITEHGKQGGSNLLGEGYVRLFGEVVNARMPELKLNIINKGISGHKVDDLRNRWKDDVMREEFDWLSVMIGINDIHCHLDNPVQRSVRQFASDYEAILSEVSRKKPRIVLIDPFFVSADRSGTFRTRVLDLLDEYIGVVDKLAIKFNAVHLRSQVMFNRIIKTHSPDSLCPEPVHPYRAGHLAIALELYKILGGRL